MAAMPRRAWHRMEPEAVLEELAVAPAFGLSETDAARRLVQFGSNELHATGRKNVWAILYEQFTAVLVIVLLAAAIVSLLLGDYEDSIAISAIVLLNAGLGFTQDYRAEKALAALKRLTVPSVTIRRDGQPRAVAASAIVPGDLLFLEAGNFIPADCRILESAHLQVDESALTGESLPVDKTALALLGDDLPVADRRNMVYSGTFVTAGRAMGVVVETGMRTELGRIAALMQVGQGPTPLQRRLDHLGRRLAAVALALVGVIFLLGLLRGEAIKLLFLTAVSIGVAAVPEGLPAVVTIALTLGAHRMLRRNVLIRSLPAVETLGAVTVICTDKTGTLTENRMTATVLQTADIAIDVLHEAPAGCGEKDSGIRLLLTAAALCNDAHPNANGGASILGDPTEAALLTIAGKLGFVKARLEEAYPRVAELPFSSGRKRMTTVHQANASYVAFSKGAADGLLEQCDWVWTQNRAEPLDDAWRARLRSANEGLASQGVRVLGMATRTLDVIPADMESVERHLTFVGMIGIVDPPRWEALPAVRKCLTAGIRPVMITGDHALTAQYVARQVGISSDEGFVTGRDLDSIREPGLAALTQTTHVYARVSPEHKLKIVESLQQQGHIVAMTGDGVNDAPALKKADIGVAMGITGADVAKEAADMVLLDDNFATIVAAVEEGRVIYDNIRKFIRYILATNSGEMWVMIVAPLLGMPLPLLPLQILWMNLVTDGLPALALAVEPPEDDTMRRPPHRPAESIFARGLGVHVLWVGVWMGALALVGGYWYWRMGDANWQTFLFTVLTLSQMGHVMAIRSERQSLFRIGLLSNEAMLGAVLLTLILQVGLVYVPFLQTTFHTRALTVTQFGMALAMSAGLFVAVEIEKWALRLLQRRRTQEP